MVDFFGVFGDNAVLVSTQKTDEIISAASDPDDKEDVGDCPLPHIKPLSAQKVVTTTGSEVNSSIAGGSVKTSKSEQNIRTYHEPADSSKMELLTTCKFSTNTKRKVKWVMGIFCQWREHAMANSQCDERIVKSDFLDRSQKDQWEEYPPRTLYQMVLCFQMHFEMHKIFLEVVGER